MVVLFSGVVFSQAVERFNANVGYSGLNHAVTHEVCEDNSCYYENIYLHIHTCSLPHHTSYTPSHTCVGSVCREQGASHQRSLAGSSTKGGGPDGPAK